VEAAEVTEKAEATVAEVGTQVNIQVNTQTRVKPVGPAIEAVMNKR